MKKLFLLAAVAGGAYLVYRQVMASRAEDDLWSEATKTPDFTDYADSGADSESSPVEDQG
jgi:hypothetical protein